MNHESLPLVPSLRGTEPIMDAQPPSPPLSPAAKAHSDLLQFEFPPGLVPPEVANTAKLAHDSAIRFRHVWDQRVRDQAGTDGDIKPRLRPTTYEMIMTLLTLETFELLPADPLPPPIEPTRPHFQFDLPRRIDFEESVQGLEAVIHHFTSPGSLLPLFNELGQTIWSNDWLRFFLIRQPYRVPVGAEIFYGVLRWWLCTDEIIIAAFLAQKLDPGLKAEVNYYIPAVQDIKTFKEWDKVWENAIDEVAKVRRKLDAGISMAFHAKLAKERSSNPKDTLPPTPRRRMTPRSSLGQEVRSRVD